MEETQILHQGADALINNTLHAHALRGADVLRPVVDEQSFGGVQAIAAQQQPIDGRVGLDQLFAAGDEDGAGQL